MHMADNKTQISEGLLTSIVDNFFKALQKGAADRYIKAADKAGAHPEAIKTMKKISDEWGELDKILKLHNKV